MTPISANLLSSHVLPGKYFSSCSFRARGASDSPRDTFLRSASGRAGSIALALPVSECRGRHGSIGKTGIPELAPGLPARGDPDQGMAALSIGEGVEGRGEGSLHAEHRVQLVPGHGMQHDEGEVSAGERAPRDG